MHEDLVLVFSEGVCLVKRWYTDMKVKLCLFVLLKFGVKGYMIAFCTNVDGKQTG